MAFFHNFSHSLHTPFNSGYKFPCIFATSQTEAPHPWPGFIVHPHCASLSRQHSVSITDTHAQVHFWCWGVPDGQTKLSQASLTLCTKWYWVTGIRGGGVLIIDVQVGSGFCLATSSLQHTHRGIFICFLLHFWTVFGPAQCSSHTQHLFVSQGYSRLV